MLVDCGSPLALSFFPVASMAFYFTCIVYCKQRLPLDFLSSIQPSMIDSVTLSPLNICYTSNLFTHLNLVSLQSFVPLILFGITHSFNFNSYFYHTSVAHHLTGILLFITETVDGLTSTHIFG